MNNRLARLHARGDRGIVVLAASSPPSHKVKYVDQVAAALDVDMTIRFRQSGGALDGVDVVHMVGSSDPFFRLTHSSGSRERLKRIRQFVEQLSTHGVALVRTVYGSAPEDLHPVEAEAAALLDSATTRFIAVDGVTSTPDPSRTIIIPHAELSERFAGYPTRSKVPGRLLCINDEAPGTTAEGVLRTFFLSRTKGLSVRLAGALDEASRAEVERAVGRTPESVTSRDETLSDAALVEEISAAEFVVVPEPQTLAGYHLLMMALTFNRPVLAPANEMVLALRDQVGESWVVPLATPITAERLDAAISQARQILPSDGPCLSGRGWTEIGRRYALVLQEAVSEVRATVELTAVAGRRSRGDESRAIKTNETGSVSV